MMLLSHNLLKLRTNIKKNKKSMVNNSPLILALYFFSASIVISNVACMVSRLGGGLSRPDH